MIAPPTATAEARIAFAGTPEFAVPSLEALLAAGYRVEPVLTQPDRPAGRGRRIVAPPVGQRAVAEGIPVLQPTKLDESFAAALREHERPDCLVVVAYGQLLPRWLLEWPRVAPINVHASLLPRWRGAAPIQQAIVAGDAETGISIMRITAGLDRGPVYSRVGTPIGAAETGGELHDRLALLGAGLLVATLPRILDGTLEPEPQDDSLATHAGRIDKRDAVIDWRRPAPVLARQIRAYNPWPVAEATTADGRRLRVWRAEVAASAAAGAGRAAPGSVVGTRPEGIDVATGEGVLRLTELQSPGGKVMSASAWLRAHSLDGTAFAAAH